MDSTAPSPPPAPSEPYPPDPPPPPAPSEPYPPDPPLPPAPSEPLVELTASQPTDLNPTGTPRMWRQNALLFQSYPFHSPEIRHTTTFLDLADHAPTTEHTKGLKPIVSMLARGIDHHESSNYPGPHREVTRRLLYQYWGVHDCDSYMMVTQKQTAPKKRALVFAGLISFHYILFDILLMKMNDFGVRSRPPTILKEPVFAVLSDVEGISKFKGLLSINLKDWIGLPKRAWSFFQGTQEAQNNEVDMGVKIPTEPSLRQSAILNILRMAVKYDKTTKIERYEKISSNLHDFIFAVRWITLGDGRLPENSDHFWSLLRIQLTKEGMEVDKLKWSTASKSRTGITGMLLAIQLSLAISPFILLVPKKLSTDSFAADKLMMLGHMIACCKPTELRQAESLLWGHLFKLCTTEQDLRSFLNETHTSFVSWETSTTVGTDARDFFSTLFEDKAWKGHVRVDVKPANSEDSGSQGIQQGVHGTPPQSTISTQDMGTGDELTQHGSGIGNHQVDEHTEDGNEGAVNGDQRDEDRQDSPDPPPTKRTKVPRILTPDEREEGGEAPNDPNGQTKKTPGASGGGPSNQDLNRRKGKKTVVSPADDSSSDSSDSSLTSDEREEGGEAPNNPKGQIKKTPRASGGGPSNQDLNRRKGKRATIAPASVSGERSPPPRPQKRRIVYVGGEPKRKKKKVQHETDDDEVSFYTLDTPVLLREVIDLTGDEPEPIPSEEDMFTQGVYEGRYEKHLKLMLPLASEAEGYREHTFLAGSALDYENVDELQRSAIKHYVDHKPRHWQTSSSTPQYNPHDDDASWIFIASLEDYRALSERTICEIFRHRHIVIRKAPHSEDGKFDMDTLRELVDPLRLLTIQDHSRRSAQDPNSIARKGFVADYYNEAIKPNGSGRPCSILDMPTGLGASEPPPRMKALSTDKFAFHGTRHKNESVPYPSNDMIWTTTGSTDSLSMSHIDAGGLATVCRFSIGTKVWAFGRSKIAGSSVAYLQEPAYDAQGLSSEYLDWEWITLEHGDVLIMRPNTIHFVLTTDNAITRGWHFYSKLTIRESYYGFIHTFMCGTSVTNIEHLPAARILRVMMHAWRISICGDQTDFPDQADFQEMAPSQMPSGQESHVPDIRNFEELFDLICIGNLIELSEGVLDSRLYQDESLPALEIWHINETRRDYHKIIDYFLAHYNVLDGDQVINAEVDLFEESLIQLGITLILYASDALPVPKLRDTMFHIPPQELYANLQDFFLLHYTDCKMKLLSRVAEIRQRKPPDGDINARLQDKRYDLGWHGPVYTIRRRAEPGRRRVRKDIDSIVEKKRRR